MSRPSRPADRRHYQARKRVPKELQAILGKTEMKRSLPGVTPAEVKRLHSEAMADFERQIAAARETLAARFEAVPLRDMLALCGDFYRREVAEQEAAPDIDRRLWEEDREFLVDRWEPNAGHDDGDYEPDYGRFAVYPRDLAEAEGLLRDAGRSPDEASVERMAQHLLSTKVLIADTMLRRARGDWGADRTAERFPTALARLPQGAEPAEPPSVTFGDLIRGWARDAGLNPDATPSPQSYLERQRVAARFARFFGHDDARRVAKADILRWKQERQTEGRSYKTIRNDLSDMSGAFSWGVRNGLLDVNPFTGTLPSARNSHSQAVESGDRTYSDEQVVTLLKAARDRSGAMRWLPWVLALTGARLDEITQSNKADVQTIDGVVCLRIHDDEDGTRQPGERARQLKNASSRRKVPLHPALIREGFLDYVASLPDGSPLFPDIPYGGKIGARSVSAQRLMRYFVRGEGIDDEKLRPSHSLRHWFITAARRAQIRRDVSDAITGHARKENEADNYGTPLRDMTELLAKEMAKIRLPEALTSVPSEPQ